MKPKCSTGLYCWIVPLSDNAYLILCPNPGKPKPWPKHHQPRSSNPQHRKVWTLTHSQGTLHSSVPIYLYNSVSIYIYILRTHNYFHVGICLYFYILYTEIITMLANYLRQQNSNDAQLPRILLLKWTKQNLVNETVYGIGFTTLPTIYALVN